MVNEHQFNTGAVEINYAEGPPKGPPLVLLHGLATRWQIFRALIRVLSRDWHVYAPDFRGHGKSGHVGGIYDVEALVQDTAAFLREVVREPSPLVGHSMGGWVAAAIAARWPELVRAIVMIDTALYPARVPDDSILMALFGIDREMIRTGSGNTKTWPQSLKELDPDVLTSYIDGHLVEGFDADDLLPRVRCPVLFLQGNPAEGGFMTDEDVASGLKLLRDARHVRFDQCGHWVHIQQPADVLRETQTFLSAL